MNPPVASEYAYIELSNVTSGDELETVARNLETALTTSHDWITRNKLSLNLSKTKVMFLGTSRRHKKQPMLK